MKNIFEMGSKTQNIKKNIGFFDKEDKKKYIHYLRNPDNFPSFHQGFKEFLIKKEYDYKNNDDLFRYIKDCAKKIDLDESTIKSFKNWIYNINNPQSNNTSRDNIYKLCFALDFTYDEVVEFFYKVYLSRPFDCRRLDEAIYLYCFNNQKSYFDYKRIKSIIINNDYESYDLDYDSTLAYITNLEQIFDEFEFINFVANNAFFSRSNVTALDKCNDLINRAMSIANVTSSKGLYEAIFNCNFRNTSSKDELESLRKSNYLKLIYKSFPKEQDFSKIRNKKCEVTYEAIRNVIILIEFYIFAQDFNSWGKIDEFNDEINDILNECGYLGLYLRNPYDWLFLHCVAQSEEDPIIEFQDIVKDFVGNED